MLSKFTDIRLSDCLTFRHGKNQSEVEEANGKYPILGTGGEIGRTNTALCSKPSVLIGRKGTINKPRYMDTPFWTVDTLFYTEIKAGYIPKYIYYLFTTIKWDQFNEASGVPSLSASTISRIKVRVPNIKTQQEIVELIEVWDQLLGTLEKKIEIKKKIKNGLAQKLLSRRTRLYDFTDEWQPVKLGNISTIKRGGSPRPIDEYITNASDGLNWLKIGDIERGSRYIRHTKQKIKPEGLKKTTMVHDGDFILSNSMSFGRPYIMKISACIHDGWLALMDIKQSVNKSFLYYMLSSSKIQGKFASLSAGSGVQNLKKETVGTVEISLPSIEEQNAIAKLLHDADDEIELLVKKREYIAEQKKYLVNNLVGGKIHIPEQAIEKEAVYA